MPLTSTPFLVNDGEFQLSLEGQPGVEYRAQVARAEFVPADSAASATYTTFADEHSDTSGETWTLEIEGFQAWADAEDLSNFLFENRGQLCDAVLIPGGGVVAADNPSFTATVRAKPTAIGGRANNYAQFTVSLSVQGDPVKVTA